MDFYYKNNFLTQVLFKVEFPVLLGLRDKSPSDFQILLRDKFPDLEEQQIMPFDKEVNQENILSMFSPNRAWKFKNLSEDEFIELSKNHLLYSCKKYVHFKVFTESVNFILDSFRKVYGESIIIKRTGLRYVNNIEIGKGNPFDWQEYIKKELLAATNKFVEDKKTIKRSIHIMEINEGEFDIKLQLGMPNPDYPNPITKKLFLLDIDCISKEPIRLQDISTRLIESHDKIQELFEHSINEGLRKEMVPIKNGD